MPGEMKFGDETWELWIEFLNSRGDKRAAAEAAQDAAPAPVLSESEAAFCAGSGMTPERYAARRDEIAAERQAQTDQVTREMGAALERYKGL